MLPSCISCTHDYGASKEHAVSLYLALPLLIATLLPGMVFYWWFATALKICQELYAV